MVHFEVESTDTFLNEILRQAEQQPLERPDLMACIRLITGYFQCDSEEIRRPGRNQKYSLIRAFLAWAVLEYSSSNLSELGRWVKRDVSTLSSSVRRLYDRVDKQRELKEDMQQLKERLASIATLQA